MTKDPVKRCDTCKSWCADCPYLLRGMRAEEVCQFWEVNPKKTVNSDWRYMDEIQIVAILDCSAGNETVGEMWKETKVFQCSASLFDVIKWASKDRYPVAEFKGNLTIAIAQK